VSAVHFKSPRVFEPLSVRWKFPMSHFIMGRLFVLRGVALAARPGVVTCLMGRNGVGKTSLLRAIMGVHPITAGAIRWDGTDISDLPTHKRARRCIVWVPQGRDIFPCLR
jgi:urea transport system ATP-binding protein